MRDILIDDATRAGLDPALRGRRARAGGLQGQGRAARGARGRHRIAPRLRRPSPGVCRARRHAVPTDRARPRESSARGQRAAEIADPIVALTPRRRLLGAAGALTATPSPGRCRRSRFRPSRCASSCRFPPGGPTDIVARPLAQMLGDALGQQVVVDNRGGAGGSIGADAVAKSPADGYALLMGTVGTHAINPALYKKLPYDATRDFTPLGLIALAPVAVVVHPGTPYNAVADLIAAAKREPGRIAFGSAGNGTPGHLTGEMFAKAAGIELKHVPYKGSAPAVTDLLGGQIPLMFDPVQSVLQHIRGGKLRALAVSSSARAPVLPQVPTVQRGRAEGLRGDRVVGAVRAGRAAGADRREACGRSARIVQAEAFREKLVEIGVQPGGAAQPFAEFQRAEIAKWGAAVRDSGVTLE
jgi:tripartite-type tricarboxylate transporter receptor subunit TctC